MEIRGERKRTRVHGLLPEYGAIFMSNTRTKEECLRKKLFGLPAAFTEFVKNVKAGMILFLFEYEKRKLHGVFEAASDGEIDIVPTAYRSSGKCFPAQVKVNRIWKCDPLSETEFSETIKDNYFGAKKFHFGLSEYQVHKLLHLFGSKKASRDLSLFTLRKCRSKRRRSLNYHDRESEDSQSYDGGASEFEQPISAMKSWGYSGTTVPRNETLVADGERWLSGVSVNNIADNQLTDAYWPGIPKVSSFKHSPPSQITQNPVKLLVESRPKRDLAMVEGCNCCDCNVDLGDFIPLSGPSSDETDLTEDELVPPYDPIRPAPYATDGDHNLSDPYIPVPIFGGQSFEMIDSNQDSPVGPDECPYPCCGQAKPVVGCQEPCCGYMVEEILPSTKPLNSDAPRERRSVFSRLSFVSKETQEEENHAKVDQFLDEVMEELQHKRGLGPKTMKDPISAGNVGEGSNPRSSSVFKRLGGGPSKTTSAGVKRKRSNVDKEYIEFMQMHGLECENMTASARLKDEI